MGHLKGVLSLFAQQLFGKGTKLRLRPTTFPLQNQVVNTLLPVLSVVVTGVASVKTVGGVEVGGCGLVDPVVLKNCDIDSEIYSGFAFGLGIDRLIMSKYQVLDIRTLYENDIRILKTILDFISLKKGVINIPIFSYKFLGIICSSISISIS